MPASKSAVIAPSNVSIVLNCLIAVDDFVSTAEVRQITGLTSKATFVSLQYLQQRKAVITVEANGVVYWGATPNDDDRIRHIDEKRKEDEPRVAKGTRTRRSIK